MAKGMPVAVYFGKPFCRMTDVEKGGAIYELKERALQDEGFMKVEHIHFEDIELDGLPQTEISGWASLHYTEV